MIHTPSPYSQAEIFTYSDDELVRKLAIAQLLAGDIEKTGVYELPNRSIRQILLYALADEAELRFGSSAVDNIMDSKHKIRDKITSNRVKFLSEHMLTYSNN